MKRKKKLQLWDISRHIGRFLAGPLMASFIFSPLSVAFADETAPEKIVVAQTADESSTDPVVPPILTEAVKDSASEQEKA